jgi:hypothetical protein
MRVTMKKSVIHKATKIIDCLLLVLIIMVFFVSSVIAGRGSIRISVLPTSELAVSVDFKDESGDKALGVGEKGRIIITVINNGKAESKNVSAKIKADKVISGLKYANKVSFGNVPEGKIVKKEVQVSAAGNVGKDTVKFSVSVKDSNGFESGPIEVTVGLKAEMRPKLVIHDFGINDKNKNLKIEPKERVILTVRIMNTGAGIARNVNVEIDYGKDVTICGSGITNFEIGEIRPGKYEDVKFSFYADKSIKRGERIPLDVKIMEARPEFNSTVPIDIKMNSVINSSQNLN